MEMLVIQMAMNSYESNSKRKQILLLSPFPVFDLHWFCRLGGVMEQVNKETDRHLNDLWQGWTKYSRGVDICYQYLEFCLEISSDFTISCIYR